MIRAIVKQLRVAESASERQALGRERVGRLQVESRHRQIRCDGEAAHSSGQLFAAGQGQDPPEEVARLRPEELPPSPVPPEIRRQSLRDVGCFGDDRPLQGLAQVGVIRGELLEPLVRVRSELFIGA